MSDQPPIRVYLVDDHEILRRGIAGLVAETTDLVVVGESGTYAGALADILALRPDVVVLDAQLSDGSGVDLCRQMRTADPSIKGLVLTTHDDADAISSAILSGASGYVLKRIDATSLLSGIRLVAAGHSLIGPTAAERVLQQMEQQKRSLAAITELTPQQRRIFFLIAEGLTNRQIGERLFLAEKTVKNHVTGLLARLGLQHRTHAALLAVRMREARSSTPPVPAPRATPAGGRTFSRAV